VYDLLLVNSPLYSEGQSNNEDYLPPIGLAYIATYAFDKGKRVSILDAINRGLSVKEVIDEINHSNPTYLGINLFSTNYELVKKICESINENIKILIGGNITTFCYKDISEWNTKSKTFIVIGEGEKIVFDIISDNIQEQAFYTYQNAYTYMVNKESVYFNKELDLLHLNRRFIENGYRNVNNQIENSIITSRGCPFNCAYCGSARSINKHTTVRRRTFHNINQELFEIETNNPDVTCVRVLDDLFLMDNSSISKAAKMFMLHPKLSWRAMAHIHTLKNGVDLFNSLYESGCSELFIGIESGSKKIRDFIDKKGEISDIIDVIQRLLRAKIQVKAYFILGFPDETEEDIEATYQLAKQLFEYSKQVDVKFRVSSFKFRPYHGTKLYKYISKHRHNIKLSHDNKTYGKDSFNFTGGNFSCVSDDLIDEYMAKMDEMRGD